MSDTLIGIAMVSALWGIASAVMITGALQKRGVKVNWLFMRVLIFKYVGQYRDLTRQETGRTGPLFYSCAIAMNVALVTAIIGLLLKALR